MTAIGFLVGFGNGKLLQAYQNREERLKGRREMGLGSISKRQNGTISGISCRNSMDTHLEFLGINSTGKEVRSIDSFRFGE